MAQPGLTDVRQAAALLQGVAAHTPLLEVDALSSRLGGRTLLKSEHLQRTGSFKIRGASVRIAALAEAERSRGVVAASAGNHAQGVAFAASRLSCGATIVMPAYASIPKIAATRALGATVILHGASFDEALEEARRLAHEAGAVLVHPFDDPLIIAGQGTVGLELEGALSSADRVVVPIGGGGLAAGVAIAVKALAPHVRVVGVRPAASPSTIADGAAVQEAGTITMPIIGSLLDDVVEVDEESISEAMLRLLEDAKQVVEGAGALPVAAMLSGATPADGTTIAVISGGNVDPGLLSRVIRHGLGIAGRYLFARLLLRDVPGELQHVLALLADLQVNVVSVVHHRLGLVLPVEMVEVELTVETRDREHANGVLEALRSRGYEVSA